MINKHKLAILGVFLGLYLALGVPYSVSAYQFEGDKVYINDSFVYLSASPHTIQLKNCFYDDTSVFPICPVEFQLQSKIRNENITAILGFDRSSVIPYRADIYKNRNWRSLNKNFEVKHKEYDGKNTWYLLDNISIEKNRVYKLKIWFRVIKRGNLKYDFAVKPSGETLQEAISSGHLYRLDPWLNLDFLFKIPVYGACLQCTGPVTGLYYINGTSGFILGSGNTTQFVVVNMTAQTTNGTMAFLYYNNETDYNFSDPTETEWLSYIVDQGNETSKGRIDDDLILFLTFNDTFDRSNYGNNAANNGATRTTGYWGFGFDFEASEADFWQIGDSPELRNMANVTIIGWSSIESFVTTTTPDNFFVTSDAPGGVNYILSVEADTGTMKGHFGGDDKLTTNLAPPDINQWVFMAVSFNGNESTAIFYLWNSTLFNTETEAGYSSSSIPDNQNNIDISGEPGSNRRYWDGIIDNVMLFNRTLTTDEIWGYQNVTTTLGAVIFGPVVNITPILTFVPPTPNETVVNTTNTVIINVSSDVNVFLCLLDWNGTNETMINASDTNQFSIKASQSNGNYTFRVYCNSSTDTFGSTRESWVLINFTAPPLPLEQVRRFCFNDENLFIREKDVSENGSATFNEYLQFCEYNCSNWTMTNLGNPGCIESDFSLALIFIVILVILVIAIRLAFR